jgi:hypothetical protein
MPKRRGGAGSFKSALSPLKTEYFCSALGQGSRKFSRILRNPREYERILEYREEYQGILENLKDHKKSLESKGIQISRIPCFSLDGKLHKVSCSTFLKNGMRVNPSLLTIGI